MHKASDLFIEVRRRPGMYLPDRRYASVVAFIEGFGIARAGLLDGFQPWLTARWRLPRSSLHWGSVVASQFGSDAGSPGVQAVESEDVEVEAANALLDALVEFLEMQ